MNKDTFLL